MGSAGQANYSAANGCLDALAATRRRGGQVGVSVQWGPWAEVGMAAGAGIHDRMKAGGFGLISIEVGLTLTLTLALTLAPTLPPNPKQAAHEVLPTLTLTLTLALTLTLTLTLGGPGGAASCGGACQPSARRSDACGLVEGAA